MNAAIPFPEFDVFALGPLELSLFGAEVSLGLRWYALAYIAGLALGWLYIRRLLARPPLWAGGRSPMAPELTDDLLFWMTIGVVLGGRVGFVLFYQPDLLWPNPLRALALWEGGMAFHGGMLGVILGVILFARVRGVSTLSLGDAVACATPIGLFFGRIANFINGELWGRPTDVSWAMIFPQVELLAPRYPWLLIDGENVGRHPSQLYEAALEGALLFAVLAWLAWRAGGLKRPGLATGVFLLGYGLARGFVEFYRQWNVELGFDFELFGVGFTRGQTLCIPMIVAGAAFIVHALRRPAARDESIEQEQERKA